MTALSNALYTYFVMADDDKLKIWLNIFTWGAGIFATISFSILSYLAVNFSELSKQISVLEATTLNAKEVEKLRESIYSLNYKVEKLPSENPPKWLLEQMSALEKRIDKLERVR